MFRKRRPPYNQVEIAEQIGDIAKLQSQRAAAPRHTDESERADNAIETAQEILNFMLEEVRDWHKRSDK